MYENQDIEKIKELEAEVSKLKLLLEIASDALVDISDWNSELKSKYKSRATRATSALIHISFIEDE